jgi:ABC-2 type transport system permease protein
VGCEGARDTNLVISYLICRVPINGAFSQIVIGILLFTPSSLAPGLIIFTVVRTKLQFIQMTVFILLLSILLRSSPWSG